MGNEIRVLVVDKDGAVLQACMEALRGAGCSVETACDGTRVRDRAFDVFVVDLASWSDVPGSVGPEYPLRGIDCRRLILTGAEDLFGRALAGELRCADYIKKPFCGAELAVRVRVVSCRLQADLVASCDQRAYIARFGDWTFDPARLELIHDDGRTERLTTAEAGLLKLFLRSPHRILAREQLLQGDPYDAGSFERSVDVLVSRLRKKLERDIREPSLISTVYGAGYQLSADVRWTPLPSRV